MAQSEIPCVGLFRSVEPALSSRTQGRIGVHLNSAASQQLDQSDDQAAPGDQRTEHPSQKIGLNRYDIVLYCRDIELCLCNIDLGRQVALSNATYSSARVSACFSVKPLSVRRLTRRCVSKAMTSVMRRILERTPARYKSNRRHYAFRRIGRSGGLDARPPYRGVQRARIAGWFGPEPTRRRWRSGLGR